MKKLFHSLTLFVVGFFSLNVTASALTCQDVIDHGEYLNSLVENYWMPGPGVHARSVEPYYWEYEYSTPHTPEECAAVQAAYDAYTTYYPDYYDFAVWILDQVDDLYDDADYLNCNSPAWILVEDFIEEEILDDYHQSVKFDAFHLLPFVNQNHGFLLGGC